MTTKEHLQHKQSLNRFLFIFLFYLFIFQKFLLVNKFTRVETENILKQKIIFLSDYTLQCMFMSDEKQYCTMITFLAFHMGIYTFDKYGNRCPLIITKANKLKYSNSELNYDTITSFYKGFNVD